MTLTTVRSKQALFTALFVALALVILFIRITPFPNDDTYIYFNYARNFVEGRAFAYDTRGIPSEVFTSLLYLLLLLPFQALGIHMMFAGIMLNIAALFLSIGLAGMLASRLLDGSRTLPFMAVFLSLLILDSNITEIIARGLETLFIPVMLFAAAWAIAGGLDSRNDSQRTGRCVSLFFAVTFLAFLIRPENLLLIGAPGGLILLIRYPNRREVIMKALGFALAFAAFHGLKMVIFGDLMPTGFYRKVTLGLSGLEYVLGAVIAYSPWVAVLVTLVWWRGREAATLLRHPVLVFLILAATGTLLFFTQVRPLVSYNYRFLMNATVGLFFFVSLSVTLAVRSQGIVYSLGTALLTASVVTAGVPLQDVAARLNLYHRTDELTQQHPYIQLASFLRAHLPEHEKITLAFGDAGIFSYAFQSRFIDTNGLSEPYLARLFRLSDGAEKTNAYIDYILSWQPDIVILGHGETANGVWTAVQNPHSPFHNPQPPQLFRRYRDYGIGYVCSIKTPFYDLHLGVWRESPYYDDIIDSLLAYCKTSGYVLADGFTVATEGEQIHFIGISP